jgi:esterase/lipase superfamily enzyme
MDRHLLLVLMIAALGAIGCNRSQEPPQVAAVNQKEEAAPKPVEYRTKTTYEFQDDVVEGNLTRPSGSDFARSSPPEPAPPTATAAPMADGAARPEAAADMQAEEQRRKAIAELQERASVLGAFGGQGFGGGANPLRNEIGGGDSAQPGAGNPLRESRIGTMAAPGILPGSPSMAPSGGSAAPTFGAADDVERFARIVTAPAGGASIQPSDSRAAPSAAPASASPAVPPAASANDAYEVVQVFYGTDRQSADPPPSDWQHIVGCFWPTATVGFVAACLTLVAVGRRSWLLGAMAAVAMTVSAGLGYEDTAEALSLVRGAGKQGPRYTTERAAAGRIERGRCEVTVPANHSAGELESPSILRLEIAENAADHLVLHQTERLADAAFYGLLRQTVSQSARRELFVFIHGFNVSFEDAARRTAQIHYDLKFDGAPIFFSWPAHDRFILTYAADETNVAWSAPHFKQFLLEIVKESGAQSINLIAHSMGNRALAAALREIELEMHEQARLFNQVILAAPDIDADDFRHNIAPAMQRTAQRLTLYASAHDEALLASQFIHRCPRAGDAGDGLIVIPGVDTIDVTPIDRSLWGHSYYGSSNPVLHDLRLLLSRAVPPRDRTWLSPAERDGLTYWIFQPIRTADAGDGITR